MVLPNGPCPVCQKETAPYDVVDFNKSSAEAKGKFLKLSGLPVYYYRCSDCGFCFAPELYKWSVAEFKEKIYNDLYAELDPDYADARPQANAKSLLNLFKGKENQIIHLDFGGGNGRLSQLLNDSGWNSACYDPMSQPETPKIKKFNLITAYEVFEHVPDVHGLMKSLTYFLSPGGVILFSTLVSDDQILPNKRLTWWYAGPRNGHISLFSKKSLGLLVTLYGFNMGSFSPAFHVLFTKPPQWAAHFIKTK